MPHLTAVAINVQLLKDALLACDRGETWALMPVGGNTPVTLVGDGLGNVAITITEPDW